MKDTINKDQFRNWFRSNEQYRNNFSYEGLSALFDYLEEMEESTGEELEFDPVALCCEFEEYDSLTDLVADYWVTIPDYKDIVPSNIEYFENRTIVIPIEKTEGFIIQQF